MAVWGSCFKFFFLFSLFYSAKMSLANLGKQFKKSLTHRDLLAIGDRASVNEKTENYIKTP